MSDNSTSICTILIIIIIIIIVLTIITPLIGKITYQNLDIHWYKNHTLLEIYNISKNIKNGLNKTIINADKLPISTDGIEYSFNFWIYIDNWDYRNFEKKTILNWGNNFTFTISDLIFGVILNQQLAYDNSINYKLAYNGIDFVPIQSTCSTGDKNCAEINPSQTLNTYMGVHSVIARDYNGIIDTNNYKDVPELPLQKWLHFVVNLQEGNLDFFVNNKLYVSKRLQYVPNLQSSKLTICPKGGFDGYINRVEYYDRILTLKEIEKKFERGPVTHNFVKQIIGWLRTDQSKKEVLRSARLTMTES